MNMRVCLVTTARPGLRDRGRLLGRADHSQGDQQVQDAVEEVTHARARVMSPGARARTHTRPLALAAAAAVVQCD